MKKSFLSAVLRILALALCSAILLASCKTGSDSSDSDTPSVSSTGTTTGGTGIQSDIFRIRGTILYGFIDGQTCSMAEIPDGVTEIASSAFLNVSLLSIVHIPASVTKICAGAFEGTGLTKAVFENTTGWSASSTSITASDLNDWENAAEYLKNTYKNMTWTRED